MSSCPDGNIKRTNAIVYCMYVRVYGDGCTTMMTDRRVDCRAAIVKYVDKEGKGVERL